MGIAILVFLIVLPAALVAMSARRPGDASLQRLAVTVFGDRWAPSGIDAIRPTLRQRRVFGAVGGVVGLWATAAWQSTTWSWSGLWSSFAPPTSAIAPGVGWITLAEGSFVLGVNVFGILGGFTFGLVAAEWVARSPVDGIHRSALLRQREASRYLPRWIRVTLALAACSAGGALVVAAWVPESLKTFTGRASGSPWWAIVLIVVAIAALATRAAVLASARRAASSEALMARETTRALTVATMTIVALAAFTGSTASSLARLSSWFGLGWGDGLATAAISMSLLTTSLVIAAFMTPYWAIAVDVDSGAFVEAP